MRFVLLFFRLSFVPILSDASLSLLVEKIGLVFSANIVSLESFGSFDDAVKETLLALKLSVGLGPGNLHFSILLKSDNTSKVIVVGVVYASDLLGDILHSRLLNAIDFERVLRAALVAHVTKQHLVIVGPVLMSLLEEYKGVDRRLTLREELPPTLRVLRFHIKGQLLAMDSNSLLAELLRVFLNHLLAPLLSDVRVGLSLALLLLHSQETHLTLVKSLFRVFNAANVAFQSFKFSQILHAALF